MLLFFLFFWLPIDSAWFCGGCRVGLVCGICGICGVTAKGSGASCVWSLFYIAIYFTLAHCTC